MWHSRRGAWERSAGQLALADPQLAQRHISSHAAVNAKDELYRMRYLWSEMNHAQTFWRTCGNQNYNAFPKTCSDKQHQPV